VLEEILKGTMIKNNVDDVKKIHQIHFEIQLMYLIKIGKIPAFLVREILSKGPIY